MNVVNSMKLSFLSRSANESFARAAVAAVLLPLDPTVAEVADVKTAVSEAVTNAIVHGYPDSFGTVYIEMKLTDTGKAIIKIRDKGVGIPDVEKAMEEAKSFSPIGAVMTGSGCCVLALFETKELCEWAKSRYRGKFRVLTASTLLPDYEKKQTRWSNPFVLEQFE